MDLKSYSRWDDYSRARDDMFAATDTAWAPWFVAHSDDKKRARLNVITHLLDQVPYERTARERRSSSRARRSETHGDSPRTDTHRVREIPERYSIPTVRLRLSDRVRRAVSDASGRSGRGRGSRSSP